MASLISWLHTVLLSVSAFSTVLGDNTTDRPSLLAFKAQVTDDPLGILNSWNESLHFCTWRGITCGTRHKKVTMLNLESSQLKGLLSPHIGNLSFLRILNLHNNSFLHHIPPEIGHLFRLQQLNLSQNSLSGAIPNNIINCSSLRSLDLDYNELTGKIPNHIGSLSKLEVLRLRYNKLVGEIPPSIGNLSSLSSVSFFENGLHGLVPDSFGRLKSLRAIWLAHNYLSGMLPVSIFNLSFITIFSLAFNQLEGTLPPQLGHTLPNLQGFYLTENLFSGPIPITISNASNLVTFAIPDNKFTGKVPSFARLSDLVLLTVADNNLGNRNDSDLDFLSSFANCSKLKSLQISHNNFGGKLPETMSNFSTKLQVIVLGENWIHGSIPAGIGNLISLEDLGIEKNLLTGPIPSSIGKLQKLNWIYLSENKLSGIIPSSIGNLTVLTRFYLDSNKLNGNIPSSLGQCKNLLTLNLSQNNLFGPIPGQVFALSSLADLLDLSQNQLTGPIPMEVGKLVTLAYLSISENKLTGAIPETLGSCTSLLYLYLDGNLLHGTIPSSLHSLRGIEQIGFSRNNFSGKIPIYLETFPFLHNLNLSFNNFEGKVPVKGVFSNASALSIMGNTRLCGGIPNLNLSSCSSNLHKKHKQSHKLKLIISIACGLVLSCSMMIFLMIYYKFKKRCEISNLESSFGFSFLKVSYRDLFEATDGFSSANLIGVGSFGSVYKGILNKEERLVVAVKVLNLQTSRALNSFAAECKALKNMKHRNLVKIVTSCSSIDFQGNDFRALVYEFLVNGSLEEWLHPNQTRNSEQENKHLGLMERVNIAIDIASAIDYLHNQCHVPISHCDLKASNILLDHDMKAKLGDFGLVRFLPDPSHPFSSDQTGSLGIRGSIGYIAPEYGMGGKVSTLGDIYSFGILLLEMFTGKRPTDIIFKDGFNLHKFSLMGISTGVEEIVDPLILKREDESSNNTTHSDCLISIIKIGIACSVQLSTERMDISNVVAQLCHIKKRLI